jgi:hypothetical protein
MHFYCSKFFSANKKVYAYMLTITKNKKNYTIAKKY